jgi:hypothetical protein
MAVRDRKSQRPIALPESITITVGVHAEEGGEAHRAANDTGAPLTNADVATFHEFGTSTIPQRSFIRAWYDEDQEFIRTTLQKQMGLVVAGKLTTEVASERIALAFEGAVKKRISRGIPPPLQPETIARKGSSRALVDTGQLRASIRGRAEVK